MGAERTSGGRPVVVITGASSGIGAAAAARLAGSGWQVFGTSRRDLPDRPGVRMLRVDVRDDASVTAAIRRITGAAGRIDAVVNNAGIMHEAFAEETGRADADAVFETNFFGAVRVTNAVLPSMRERRYGRIVNVGSLAAWIGEPGEAVYAASKAALARYTEALRHEVWHLGIHVSLLEPGAFATGVLDSATARPEAARVRDYDGPREAARRVLHRNLENGADPREAGEIIAAILRARRPRGRYAAGRDARWIPLLTTLAPGRLTDHLLRRAYGLPGRAAVRRTR